MSRNSDPFPHEETIPEALLHLQKIHVMLAEQGLPTKLSHLIELRVSQINQCAYCVKLHSGDARREGEKETRLDRLIVWRQVDDFSDAEKAAFAWAEALTYLRPETDFASLRAGLRAHYDETQASLITLCVGMINLWNRAQVSNH
ncbi:MAG: carboxymuconolactone decarboxylase family protein [Rhodospirillales bacterium]